MSKVAMGLFAVSIQRYGTGSCSRQHSALGRNNTGKYSHSNLGVYPICLAYMSVFRLGLASIWYLPTKQTKDLTLWAGACPSLTRPRETRVFIRNHILFLILF